MINWYLGTLAIAVWLAATLLYLRGPILRAIASWREQRKAAQAARARRIAGGHG